MNLPDPYLCRICGTAVTPGANQTLRLIRAWVKGDGKSVQHVENEEFLYMHEWCLKKHVAPAIDTIPLF